VPLPPLRVLFSVVFFFALLVEPCRGDSATKISSSGADAVLLISEPDDVGGKYLARLAPYSLQTMPGAKLSLVIPESASGCHSAPSSSKSPPSSTSVVLLVEEGECSVEDKAWRAHEAGATGIAIVSHNGSFPNLDPLDHSAAPLVVFGVTQKLGELLKKHVAEVRFSLLLYTPGPMLDLSSFLVIALATSLVAAGAFYSTADLRANSPIAPDPDEVLELDAWAGPAMCLMGSAALVTLYFLMRYLIYALIFGFSVAGASTILEMMQDFLRYRLPSLKAIAVRLRWMGEVDYAQVIGASTAATTAVCWLVLRNGPSGWLFQDIMGAGVLCLIQKTVRLPNVRVATVLFSIAFSFDIFWVFGSKLFFEHGVMEEVATGGGTGEMVPMLLRIPSIGDPVANDRMLGFGDVAVPGLLISYLRRHDILTKKVYFDGYFAPGLVAYASGLLLTLVSLYLMQSGQPALMFLVPSTLGTCLVLSWRRGEWSLLWHGIPTQDATSGLETSFPDALAAGATCA